MKHKILIFGKGFIGEKLRKALKCDISSKLIYTFGDAEQEIKKYRPKIIINCIGYTGDRNVDDCEIKRDETLFANTSIPILLADVALQHKIKFVHISSGCIFHYNYKNDKPITEQRTPDYFDLFYSRSKIYSERALEALTSKYNVLIVRIRIPLDSQPHPKNVLTKLIKYKKVIDIPNSLTYIPDFIKALRHLVKIDAKGIYNVVNKGGLRYPKLLDIYKKYVPDYKFSVMNYKKLNLVRTNLVLSTKKLEKSGFKVRNISEVLEECVKKYIKY